jgi:hypothetical protein
MDNLFAHPGFRLIFIDEDGSMSLVTPLDHKKGILEDGYRCISHYWGNAIQWEDHPIKNVMWGVCVRQEKRERLLQVFNHHKGYWWMDVFCTNQEDINKPLDVMGDIYRYCKECICLLDTICDIPGFTSEKEALVAIAKSVEKCTWISYKDDVPTRCTMLSSCNVDTYPSELEYYVRTIRNANWFKRVWTWQEAVLPPKLLFCSEQTKPHKYEPFDDEFLRGLLPCDIFGRGKRKIPNVRSGETPFDLSKERFETEVATILESFRLIVHSNDKRHDIWDNIRIAADSERICTNEEDYVYGITGVLNVSIPMNLTLDKAMDELEKELQKQGIFIGYGIGTLNYSFRKFGMFNFFMERKLIDGILVLGNANDVHIDFDSNVNVSERNYGRISEKGHDCYITETSTIYLYVAKYDIGDTIWITEISRKGCTFERRQGICHKNEIFEIVDTRVNSIGYVA